MVNVIEQYCTKNPCYKEYRPLDSVKKLIVHSPAVIEASGYSTNVIITGDKWFKRWNTANINKLAHGFIDTDGVHLFLPLDITGWQVGNWYGNCNSIGFEFCEYTDLEKARQVYNVGVQYYADLVKKYGLNISDVIGHKEAHDSWYGSNHSDPDPYFKTFGKSMVTFREDVRNIIEGKKEAQEEVNLSNIKVAETWNYKPQYRKCGVGRLAILNAPSNDAQEIGYLKNGDGVTVFCRYENGFGFIYTGTITGFVDCSGLKK